MSNNIVRREKAEKEVFSFQPKPFKVSTAEVAKDFIKRQGDQSSGFQISEVLAEQAGVAELRRRELEQKVEELVLERTKEIQEKAYQEGYSLGLTEGSEKAFKEKHEELKSYLEKFDSLFTEIDNAKKNIFKENEAHLVRLTFQIGEKIAMRSIEEQKEPILEMLKTLVEDLQDEENVIINLSQGDFRFIEDLRKKNVKEAAFLKKARLNANENVADGSCFLETSFGAIDAAIEERVSRVWKALQSKMPSLKGHKTDLPLNPGQADDSQNISSTKDDATVKDDASLKDDTTKDDNSDTEGDDQS